VTSGTYYEDVVINKYNLTLVGEDKSTTIIDGGTYGSVITITADHATVSNFTVQGGGGWKKARIHLDHTSYNTISNNNINGNQAGCWADIYMRHSDNNIISNNIIEYSSEFGICLEYSPYNTISNNIVSHCNSEAINIRSGSNNNFIYNNTLSNNGHVYYGAATPSTTTTS